MSLLRKGIENRLFRFFGAFVRKCRRLALT